MLIQTVFTTFYDELSSTETLKKPIVKPILHKFKNCLHLDRNKYLYECIFVYNLMQLRYYTLLFIYCCGGVKIYGTVSTELQHSANQ